MYTEVDRNDDEETSVYKSMTVQENLTAQRTVLGLSVQNLGLNFASHEESHVL